MFKLKTPLYFIASILLLSGKCDPDPAPTPDINGCMEANACNYKPTANKDDGSCYYCNDCTGNSVESTDAKGTVNINVFDTNSSSNYYNQVVILFTVNWIQDVYCQDFDNKFYIKFKNITSNTMTFDYLIQSNADGQIRSTQGVVQNLAPNETYETLTPPNSFWNINLYPIQIFSNNIQYN